MDNIEQLRTEVDEIKNSLNTLKNNVSISEDDKRNKANLLNRRAEKTKQRIQNEISSLTKKTDEESKKKKEEAETLLTSFEEIKHLYSYIINPSENINTHQTTEQLETTVQKKESDKGFLDKTKEIYTNTKEWVWNQWNNIRDKEKWNKEWWMNLLRTTWFVTTWVWVISLAYKGIKKLFWLWKNKKESNNSKKDENIKSKGWNKIRNTWYWKTLKWIWILGAAWWGGYFLGKKLNSWWNKNNITENESNQTESNSAQIQENTNKDKKESQETTTWSDKISNEMFEQLLKMEGKHEKGKKLVAKTGKQFWEKFPTGPFGMVYKHIDNKGNLLKKAIPFKEWEEVTEEWGRKNAKTCYDKRAKEIKEAFDKKWYKLSQDQIDALTSTCWWTSKSRKNCLNYVLDNWNDQKKVVKYISTHSTTAAWNGKVMPGLVYRRKFEADWFIWNKMTFAEHRAKQKKWENTNSNGSYLA